MLRMPASAVAMCRPCGRVAGRAEKNSRSGKRAAARWSRRSSVSCLLLPFRMRSGNVEADGLGSGGNTSRPCRRLDDVIRAELVGRPYELVAVAGGWQHRTRRGYSDAIRAATGQGADGGPGSKPLSQPERLVLMCIAYFPADQPRRAVVVLRQGVFSRPARHPSAGGCHAAQQGQAADGRCSNGNW